MIQRGDCAAAGADVLTTLESSLSFWLWFRLSFIELCYEGEAFEKSLEADGKGVVKGQH